MSPVLYTIERFSGIIAMFIAWLFVVASALKFGINSKSDTITTSTTKSGSVRLVISCGLVVGALFQSIFLFYLIRRFSVQLFNLGSVLYLSANMATIFVAFFTQNKHPKIHKIMALYYFLVCPFSLLFIGFSIKSSNQYPLLVSMLAPIMYFIGQAFLWKKYRFGNTLMELWAFVVLSV